MAPGRCEGSVLFSGRLVEAEEAHRIGLVNEVVPAAEVYPAAVAMAERYAAGPTVAFRNIKIRPIAAK